MQWICGHTRHLKKLDCDAVHILPIDIHCMNAAAGSYKVNCTSPCTTRGTAEDITTFVSLYMYIPTLYLYHAMHIRGTKQEQQAYSTQGLLCGIHEPAYPQYRCWSTCAMGCQRVRTRKKQQVSHKGTDSLTCQPVQERTIFLCHWGASSQCCAC